MFRGQRGHHRRRDRMLADEHDGKLVVQDDLCNDAPDLVHHLCHVVERKLHFRQREDAGAVNVDVHFLIPQFHVRGGDENFSGPMLGAADVRGGAFERNGKDDGFRALERRGLRKRSTERQRLDVVVPDRALHERLSSNASREMGVPSTSMSRLPGSNCGRFRFAARPADLHASAVARIGSAMVGSACPVTCAASVASLPQLCASSRVDPEAPPKCGTSVTIWSAYLWPPTASLKNSACTLA